MIFQDCFFLQGRTIKGQIIDENNEPLIGVSVTVKGANTIGTITDFDGSNSSSQISLFYSAVSYHYHFIQCLSIRLHFDIQLCVFAMVISWVLYPI